MTAPTIVRLSRGSFAPDRHAAIAQRLAESAVTLVPAIRALPGCLGYYAGIDAASGTMINVSLWSSIAHAEAMSTLAPMLALAGEFIALGVAFERPIINYQASWSIAADGHAIDS